MASSWLAVAIIAALIPAFTGQKPAPLLAPSAMPLAAPPAVPVLSGYVGPTAGVKAVPPETSSYAPPPFAKQGAQSAPPPPPQPPVQKLPARGLDPVSLFRSLTVSQTLALAFATLADPAVQPAPPATCHYADLHNGSALQIYGNIQQSNVQEGQYIGDCWILSMLKAMLYRGGPNAIYRIITQQITQPLGTFTATFFTSYEGPIPISPPAPVEVLVDSTLPVQGTASLSNVCSDYPDVTNSIAWPVFIVKAYAKFADVYTRAKTNAARGYQGLDYGSPCVAAQALTGKPCTCADIVPNAFHAQLKSCDSTPNSLCVLGTFSIDDFRKLAGGNDSMVRNGYRFTIDATYDLIDVSDSRSGEVLQSIVPSHAYTLIGPYSDYFPTVSTVSNPWGFNKFLAAFGTISTDASPTFGQADVLLVDAFKYIYQGSL